LSPSGGRYSNTKAIDRRRLFTLLLDSKSLVVIVLKKEFGR
jgi:hypothetical protein